jgi:hypothetical protein
MKVKQDDVWGRWSLIPTIVPDKAYLLAIDYIAMPDDIDETSAGDATKPIYPSDITLVKAVVASALQYLADPRDGTSVAAAQAADEDYGASAVQDRIRYGYSDGSNDTLRLDSRVHRY